MTSERLAAISFGATLAVVVALRLNAAGMLLVATALLAALLLCPLLALRALTLGGSASLPDIRIERPTRPALGGPRAAPQRGLLVRRRSARRGGWAAWPRAYPLALPKRWTAVGAVATPYNSPSAPESDDNAAQMTDHS